MPRDPYDDFVQDIDAAFRRADNLKTTRNASSVQELREALVSLRRDVNDVRETVRVVEGDPARFGIDEVELERRRSYITQCEKHLSLIHI